MALTVSHRLRLFNFYGKIVTYSSFRKKPSGYVFSKRHKERHSPLWNIKFQYIRGDYLSLEHLLRTWPPTNYSVSTQLPLFSCRKTTIFIVLAFGSLAGSQFGKYVTKQSLLSISSRVLTVSRGRTGMDHPTVDK